MAQGVAGGVPPIGDGLGGRDTYSGLAHAKLQPRRGPGDPVQLLSPTRHRSIQWHRQHQDFQP